MNKLTNVTKLTKDKVRPVLILAIVFVVFNILVFVIPFRRNAVFWITYVFAAVMILAQAAAYIIAFRNADSLRRVFLGLPIMKISLICLIAQLAVSLALMLISLFITIPAWIAVILCVLIFAFAAIAVIAADWARDEIEKIDVKGASESSFIYQLRADLDSLIPRVADGELRKKVEKLAEEARYSDPVSAVGLEELEGKIASAFASLKDSVVSNSSNGSDPADCSGAADELSFLLTERSNQLRVLRHSAR